MLFLIASVGWAQDPSRVRIDHIVGVVGDRLVMDSEAQMEAALEETAVYELSALAPRRQDPVQWLMDLAVIRRLAGDVRTYQPTPPEVAERMQQVREGFESPNAYATFLESHDLDEVRLQAQVYSRMVVERVIRRNVGVRLAADVGDDEYLAAYEQWITERRGQVAIRSVQDAR